MGRRRNVALLLLTEASLLAWLGWAAAPNRTEVGHMAATVYLWNTLRFDVFRVNPPLTRMIGGLPVVMCRPKYDWDCYSSRPQDRSEWALGNAFIAANSPENVRWCFALGRWFLIPILLTAGYFGHRLGREMYGDWAAALFLVLWCSSSFLLAWGATICPDAVAAGLGLVAVWAFRGWMKKPNWARAGVAGVCLGILLLAKLTWIIVFGLWPLIWCVWTVPSRLSKAEQGSRRQPPLRQLAAILVLGLYFVNLGYLFDGTGRRLGEYDFLSRTLAGGDNSGSQAAPVAGNRFAGTWLGAIPVPLPADSVQGIDTQRCDFERGLPSYLRGEWSDQGWWYYYLYALAIKVPLGTWCLLGLALGVTIFARSYSAEWRDEMVLLAPGLAILVFVSSQTGFSIHSRYVIPALPFFFVWASKVGRVFDTGPCSRKRRALAVAVVMALAWSVTSSLWVYPHSLSYFNELVGGPKHGGEHLLDSNIDWGQDLFYLKDWLDEHPEVKLEGLACFGSYPVTLAGIPETPHPPQGPETTHGDPRAAGRELGPQPGWYALSVNYLYSRSRQYRYFLQFEPVGSAGYSIYIYHVTPEEADRVRRKIGLTELRGSKAEVR